MEGFLNLIIRLFWGWGFPYISPIHTAYIGFRTSILGTVPEMFGDWMSLLGSEEKKVRIRGFITPIYTPI